MIWHLIRHAESEANEQKVWTGQKDVGLSQKGREDLERLRQNTRYPVGDFYVTSPLRRCADSLRLLYDREADLIVDEFIECDLGEWVGLPYTDLTADPRYLRWVKKPDFAAPGGESLNTFRERVKQGWERIMPLLIDRREVVFLMHGNVIRALMSLIVNQGKAHHEWIYRTTEGTVCILRTENLSAAKKAERILYDEGSVKFQLLTFPV